MGMGRIRYTNVTILSYINMPFSPPTNYTYLLFNLMLFSANMTYLHELMDLCVIASSIDNFCNAKVFISFQKRFFVYFSPEEHGLPCLQSTLTFKFDSHLIKGVKSLHTLQKAIALLRFRLQFLHNILTFDTISLLTPP